MSEHDKSQTKICGIENLPASESCLKRKIVYIEDNWLWQYMSHPAYADVTMVFQDDSLLINKSILAVVSSLCSSILEDIHDIILLPGLKIQDFFDLILFFTELSMTEGQELPLSRVSEEVGDMLEVLGVNLFQLPASFLAGLQHVVRTLPQSLNQPEQDPFAPGYALKLESPKEEQQALIKTRGGKKTVKDCKKEEEEEEEEDAKDSVNFKFAKREEENDFAQMLWDDSWIEQTHTTTATPAVERVLTQLYSCKVCQQQNFASPALLELHLQELHGLIGQLWHCVYCCTPFMDKNTCLLHEMDKCKNTENICYRCGKKHSSRASLLKHLVSVHRHGVKRTCPHCSKSFLTLGKTDTTWPHEKQCCSRLNGKSKEKRRTGHDNETRGGKICPHCHATYRDAWKHRRHCTASNGDIKYSCKSCKKGFRRLGTLKKHFKLISKCKNHPANQAEFEKLMVYVETNIKGRTVCQDCGCEYLTKKGPVEHRKNCSAYTTYKCHACNRGINALEGFHIHFNKFPLCRMSPRNKTVVAEILAKSQKPDFHVCHLCGVQYKIKDSLEKHMLTHNENVDYLSCPQADCGKKFLTGKSLDLHLKNHVMPMVICSVCGKQVKAGSLALHMILHTGKKVSCPFCAKLFQHKGVLNKHIKSSHEEKKAGKSVKSKKKRLGTEAKEDIFILPHHQGDVMGSSSELVPAGQPAPQFLTQPEGGSSVPQPQFQRFLVAAGPEGHQQHIHLQPDRNQTL